MSTVKFDRQLELDELIAKIYLDTHLKLSKKELLELIFDIVSADYDLIIQRVKARNNKDTRLLREKFIEMFSGSIHADKDEIDPKSIWEQEVEG